MPKPKVHILRDGRRIGPYDMEELRSRIQLAVIDPEEACIDGLTEEEWTCGEWLDEFQSDEEEVDDDEFFDPGEVLWQGHPSILHYSAPLFISLFLTAGGIGLLAWRFELWIGAALAAFGLATLGGTLILRGTRHYLISERRVELLYGLISRSSQEVLIDDIRAINVRKSGLKGILGIGNVEFSTAGSAGVEISFDNVSAANKVKQLVRELQDEIDEEN